MRTSASIALGWLSLTCASGLVPPTAAQAQHHGKAQGPGGECRRYQRGSFMQGVPMISCGLKVELTPLTVEAAFRAVHLTERTTDVQRLNEPRISREQSSVEVVYAAVDTTGTEIVLHNRGFEFGRFAGLLVAMLPDGRVLDPDDHRAAPAWQLAEYLVSLGRRPTIAPVDSQ